MGFTVDDKKLKRAGLDYWHLLDITYYEGLTDFFARNEGPFYYFTTKAPQRYTDVAYPDGAYLVFGRDVYKRQICASRSGVRALSFKKHRFF